MNEETYDYTWNGKAFKRDKIVVERLTPWYAFIKHEGENHKIFLQDISPLFISFLRKSFKENG